MGLIRIRVAIFGFLRAQLGMRILSWYSPKISADDDYGAAASTTGDGKDYRDLDLEHEQIKAFSLEEILRERPVFDYVHVDIQGAELPLIENALDTIKRKVKTLFIGTHSRHIESELVKIFENNWPPLSVKSRAGLTGALTRRI